MDAEAIGMATASDTPEGKFISNAVFPEDPPVEKGTGGESFRDEVSMKNYYLEMARQLYPETAGQEDFDLLERLLKRLRKRRILLNLMCREWYRGYGFLQAECLNLLVEIDLPVEKRRGIARVLNGQLNFVYQLT